MTVTLLHGDCRDLLRTLPDASVDSVVTDPPYELGFMGRAWDATGIAYSVALWREVARVLKPGGHVVAFGGTRTYHRMACAMEDAGLEIRDSLHWLYGSGFPKSHDVSKALDKAAGAERAVVGFDASKWRDAQNYGGGKYGEMSADHYMTKATITAPATDLAAQWAGWGTALKPAHEPVVLARKPLAGTVAATVAQWGTGGINVDACRVDITPTKGDGWRPNCVDKDYPVDPGDARFLSGLTNRVAPQNHAGRWPPNVLLTHSAACQPVGTRQVRGDKRATTGGKQQVQAPGQHGIYNTFNGIERGPPAYGTPDGTETVPAWACAPDCPVAALDRQSGTLHSGERKPSRRPDAQRGSWGMSTNGNTASAGGASRFFPVLAWDPATDVPFAYVPKASRAERNAGCAGLPAHETLIGAEGHKINPMTGRPVVDLPRANHHPTVKPVALMRWLVRLVTPPGGTVLDPFLGSGTTGIAALHEGYSFIGCEQDAEYLAIAQARIAAAHPRPEAA